MQAPNDFRAAMRIERAKAELSLEIGRHLEGLRAENAAQLERTKLLHALELQRMQFGLPDRSDLRSEPQRRVQYSGAWNDEVGPLYRALFAINDRAADMGKVLILQGFLLNTGALVGLVLVYPYIRDVKATWFAVVESAAWYFGAGILLAAFTAAVGYFNFSAWNMEMQSRVRRREAILKHVHLGTSHEEMTSELQGVDRWDGIPVPNPDGRWSRWARWANYTVFVGIAAMVLCYAALIAGFHRALAALSGII
jgi:hypothetical protein